MSFHFFRITLRDWLAYEDKVSIDFSHSQDGRNIWIVYGLNGYGKTSLLRAIQWLFHDDMPDRHIKECFNHNALRDGRDELSVAAEFFYNGRHYHLIRRAKANVVDGKVDGYPRTTVELTIDQEAQKAGVADKIGQILPKECQQFFFFDGLEIEKYATDVHTEETKEAIETVLGIPEVRNLEEDLDKLARDLERERDQLLRDQSEYQELSERKEEAKFELDASKDTLKNLRTKRENLEQQIDRLRERANELDRERDAIAHLKDLRRRKEILQERLDSYEDTLRSYLKAVSFRLVLPLLKERQVQLTSQTHKAKRSSDSLTRSSARTELIKDLLEKTDCICGRELDAQSRKFLEAQLAELEEQLARSRRIQERTGSYVSAVTELKDLEKQIALIESKANPEEIERAFLAKYKLQVELEEAEQDMAVLEERLKGSQDADIQAVFTTLGEKRQNLSELTDRIERAKRDVTEAEKILTERQRELNEAAQAIDDKRRVVDALQLTLKSRSVAQDLVERMLQLRRESIERHMTNVFRMVTNKKKEYDRIELTEDFAPSVVTQSEQRMRRNELSAGEKEVVAFSFIAGLNQSTETNAPLVMDTPFGHLDVSHRDGLLDALPKLPCQVILLATDRDVPEEDLPNLAYCLGGRFNIIRDETEERSRIESVPV
jgi:DNA sulfur modification protein DndD